MESVPINHRPSGKNLVSDSPGVSPGLSPIVGLPIPSAAPGDDLDEEPPPEPGSLLPSNSQIGAQATKPDSNRASRVQPSGLGDELGTTLGWITGVGIAFLSLVVPLTTVVLDRESASAEQLLLTLPPQGARHGSHEPSSHAGSRLAQSSGRDSSR